MNMLLIALLALGVWRKRAIVFTGAFVLLFVLLTGGEASAVRAGIMGGLVLAAQYLGRIQASFSALVIAVSGMLLLNPLLLRYDIGFQLSFLAVIGMIFSLRFFQWLLKDWKKLNFIRDILASNFSAQLFTIPVLVYNFGTVSVVGILANILILPMVPFLLGISFIFILCGVFIELLGIVLSFPVILLLMYMVGVTDILSGLPFASVSVENLSPVILILFYLLILWFLWRFHKKHSSPFFLQENSML